jgi:hypothetical protein
MLNAIETDLERSAEPSYRGIPGGLDAMAPGPVMAAWLSAIDVDALSGYDRVVVLRAHQRLMTHYAAKTYRDMAAITDAVRDELLDVPGETEMAAEAEIRVALTWTRRLAESELTFALDVQQRLPRLFTLLEAGALDVRRAKVIVDGTVHLSDGTAREVVDRILDDAPSLTTGQLQARIRKLCIQADADEAKNRYATAVEARRVVMQPTVDGTAHLFAFDLHPHDAAAASRHINRLARNAKSQHDRRTADQIRADVFVDLLCGRDAATDAAGRGTVDIRVDLDTLSGLNDHPGELAGYGPVIADVARKVAADQHDVRWRYTIMDPTSGRPVASGTTRRRPTASQRRAVEAMHATCVFPGCRMPAADCDLDHRRDWAKGGPTTIGNLGPLCKYDHRIKHVAGWRYRIGSDGQVEWTSKLGHTYPTARPPP